MPYRTGDTNVERLNGDKAGIGTTSAYVDEIWERRDRGADHENTLRAQSFARKREVMHGHEAALERLNRQH